MARGRAAVAGERKRLVDGELRPEDLETIIGGREITEKVLKQLVDEGILWMDGDKRLRKVKVQGFGGIDRDRWYCFWDDALTKQ